MTRCLSCIVAFLLLKSTCFASEQNRALFFNGAHFEGSYSVVGDYMWELPEKVKLHEFENEYAYELLNPKHFGVFYLLSSTGDFLAKDHKGRAKSVRPLHYPLGESSDGKTLYGTRFLPIVNREVVFDSERSEPVPSRNYPNIAQTNDGQNVVGSSILDNQLSSYYFQKEFYNTETQEGLLQIDLPSRQQGIEESVALENRVDNAFPIMSVLAYNHPGFWSGRLGDIANAHRHEIQGSFSHMGLYYGLGRTKDAPIALYDARGGLGVAGEPAISYGVKLKTKKLDSYESSKWVNKNLLIVSTLLHKGFGGVVFADRYDQDPMMQVSLRELLLFWRGWIQKDWVREDILSNEELSFYKKVSSLRPHEKHALSDDDKKRYQSLSFYEKLRNDQLWFIYCSEFVSNVYNLALNLLQNKAAYQKAYGDKVGAQLWALVEAEYKAITKSELQPIPQKAFSPLYESSQGYLESSDKTLLEEPFSKVFGESFAWAPQKTADLIFSFLTTYVNWVDVGSEKFSLLALGLGPELQLRMGISLEQYFTLIAPVVSSAIAKDIALRDRVFPGTQNKVLRNFYNFKSYTARLVRQLYSQAAEVLYLNGSEYAVVEKGIEQTLVHLHDERTYEKAKKLRLRLNLLPANKSNKLYRDARIEVYADFVSDISDDLEKFKNVPVAVGQLDPEGLNYLVANYSPPSILQRIVHNLHKSHKRVEVKALGTVVDYSEVRLKTDDEKKGFTHSGESILELSPNSALNP